MAAASDALGWDDVSTGAGHRLRVSPEFVFVMPAACARLYSLNVVGPRKSPSVVCQ